MKKLLLLLSICLLTLITNGQTSLKNHVSATFQPQDLGIGLKYDRMFNKVGVYTSLAYGNYKFGNGNYINDHYKTALGILYQSNDPFQSFLMIGITYHTYGERDITGIEHEINENVFKPFSFEFGASTAIGRFLPGFRMDLGKWEGCFELGYIF